MLTKLSVAITTNSAGAGTGYTPEFSGLIHQIRYVKTDYDNGVDFVMTLEDTGTPVLTDANCNASEAFYPRVATNAVADGAALTDYDRVAVYKERLKIVVADGGNAKTGTFHVWYEV